MNGITTYKTEIRRSTQSATWKQPQSGMWLFIVYVLAGIE